MALLQLKYRLINSKLVNDSFWALLGNVMGKGLAFVSAIVVARLLGKNIFGEFSILKYTLQSVAVYSTLGLGYTATKYVADFKKNNPAHLNQVLRFTNKITLIISGAFTIIVILFASWIATNILKASYLATPLIIISVWVVLFSMSTSQLGILAGFNAFKELAKISALIGILTFILAIVLSYFWGIYGAIIALLLSEATNCLLNKVVINKYSESVLNAVVDKKLRKEILLFTLPIAIQEITYVLSVWILNLLLVNYSNYGEVGLYSVTTQWTSVILFIPGILRNVVLSHLSSNVQDEKRHKRVIKITALFSLIATLIPALIVFLCSKFITELYGTSFTGLGPILSIAVFSTVFSSMTNVYTQAFLSLGKNWLMLAIRLLRDSALVGLAWFFLVLNNGNNGALLLVEAVLIVHTSYFIITYLVYTFLLQKKTV